MDRRRGFADDALIREVLAGDRNPLHVEVAAEMVLDFADGPGVPRLPQVVDDRREDGRRPRRDVGVGRLERVPHSLLGLLRIEKIGIDDLEEGRVHGHRLRKDLAVGQHAAADHLDYTALWLLYAATRQEPLPRFVERW